MNTSEGEELHEVFEELGQNVSGRHRELNRRLSLTWCSKMQTKIVYSSAA